MASSKPKRYMNRSPCYWQTVLWLEFTVSYVKAWNLIRTGEYTEPTTIEDDGTT